MHKGRLGYVSFQLFCLLEGVLLSLGMSEHDPPFLKAAYSLQPVHLLLSVLISLTVPTEHAELIPSRNRASTMSKSLGL